jgi:hypothetical protein
MFVDSISYAESSPESVLEDGGSPMWSETDEKLAIDSYHPDGLEMEDGEMNRLVYVPHAKQAALRRAVGVLYDLLSTDAVSQ